MHRSGFQGGPHAGHPPRSLSVVVGRRQSSLVVVSCRLSSVWSSVVGCRSVVGCQSSSFVCRSSINGCRPPSVGRLSVVRRRSVVRRVFRRSLFVICRSSFVLRCRPSSSVRRLFIVRRRSLSSVVVRHCPAVVRPSSIRRASHGLSSVVRPSVCPSVGRSVRPSGPSIRTSSVCRPCVVRPSVRPSIRSFVRPTVRPLPSVRPFVRPSVRPSVHRRPSVVCRHCRRFWSSVVCRCPLLQPLLAGLFWQGGLSLRSSPWPQLSSLPRPWCHACLRKGCGLLGRRRSGRQWMLRVRRGCAVSLRESLKVLRSVLVQPQQPVDARVTPCRRRRHRRRLSCAFPNCGIPLSCYVVSLVAVCVVLFVGSQ